MNKIVTTLLSAFVTCILVVICVPLLIADVVFGCLRIACDRWDNVVSAASDKIDSFYTWSLGKIDKIRET